MLADYDAAAALERIENELIDSMMRNLKRHLNEESDMGFDWKQWQVQQLEYLENFRKRNAKKYGPQFASINRRIKHAITHGRASGQKEEEMRILQEMKDHPELKKKLHKAEGAEIQGGDFFKINENKLNALVKATTNDMAKAEHAVLRRTNDQYRKIIFDAQMYANTGAGTVKKAVDMATHDFLKRGIDCIEYKNGARHTISDYADMAIRTAERRAYLMGAGEKRKEWGMSLVIVNRRGTMTNGNYGTACPECIPWLGKILIDDVYSDGRPDGKHELLSTAIQQGFLHPRCRDGFETYFPGITSVPDPVTKKELKAGAEHERREARKNYAELQAEKFGRLAEYSLDPENKQKYEAREEEWKSRLIAQDETPDKYARSIIDDILDPEDDTPIIWPEKGERMGKERAKQLRKYGKQKGIDIGGLDDYDLPEESVKEVVDDAAEYLKNYPELKTGRPSISFTAEYMNSSKSFAGTTNHLITINADAYRDLKRLEEEYQKLVEKHWFPKGSNHHALIAHEIGHVIHHHYPEINPIEIAMKISEKKSKTGLMDYISEHLSDYAAYYENGQEIISECYACVLTGVDNDFALKFVQECDKIIKKYRREVL